MEQEPKWNLDWAKSFLRGEKEKDRIAQESAKEKADREYMEDLLCRATAGDKDAQIAYAKNLVLNDANTRLKKGVTEKEKYEILKDICELV